MQNGGRVTVTDAPAAAPASEPVVDPVNAPRTAPSRARRRRGRRTLSIRSLLLIMLLSVSIGSNLVVGVIGYLHGTESLRQVAFDRLTETRDSRAREITALFDSVEASLLIAARNGTVIDAEAAFAAGFARAQREVVEPDDEVGRLRPTGPERKPTPDSRRRPAEHAREPTSTSTFAPAARGRDRRGGRRGELPARSRRRRSTSCTTTRSRTADRRTNDAGDGSAWSATHAEFHDSLRRMAELQGFDDLVLLDRSGDIVYSVGKNVDLGSNVLDGPYQYSSLASAFGQAMAAGRLDQVVFGDFDAYPPATGAPVAWGVAPFGAAGELTGAIAVRLPAERIDTVMTVRRRVGVERPRRHRRGLPGRRRPPHAVAVAGARRRPRGVSRAGHGIRGLRGGRAARRRRGEHAGCCTR